MKSVVRLITKFSSTVMLISLLSTSVRLPSALKTKVLIDIEVVRPVLPANVLLFPDATPITFLDGAYLCQA